MCRKGRKGSNSQIEILKSYVSRSRSYAQDIVRTTRARAGQRFIHLKILLYSSDSSETYPDLTTLNIFFLIHLSAISNSRILTQVQKMFEALKLLVTVL